MGHGDHREGMVKGRLWDSSCKGAYALSRVGDKPDAFGGKLRVGVAKAVAFLKQSSALSGEVINTPRKIGKTGVHVGDIGG